MEIDYSKRKLLAFPFFIYCKLSYQKLVLANNFFNKIYIGSAYNHEGNSFYGVFNLNGNLINSFKLPLRAHDSLYLPGTNKIVVISRRTGNKIFILNLKSNKISKIIHAPDYRHFYGHGVYCDKTKFLYVTENNYKFNDERSGSIAIYDTKKDFSRIGEFITYGIGPHEIKIFRDTIIIANGGVLTHPDFPRIKLNLKDIQSNITRVNINNGELKQKLQLNKKYKNLSIRHFDIDRNNNIYAGCQVYNKVEQASENLVFSCKSNKLKSFSISESLSKELKNYTGSIKLNIDNNEIYASFPRGNHLISWNINDHKVKKIIRINDVCGMSYAKKKKIFLISDGQGNIYSNSLNHNLSKFYSSKFNFDNHFINFTLSQ